MVLQLTETVALYSPPSLGKPCTNGLCCFQRSLDQVPEAIESYKRAVWHQAADSSAWRCNPLQQKTL